MAETTNISWADATLNFWIGCTKVSRACDNCYAELWGNRFGVKWGPREQRRRTVKSLAKAKKLQRKAMAEGRKIFCFSNSLSDIFDNEVPIEWLRDAFEIMRQTPDVIYLLLTKRPQNIEKRSIEAGGLPPNAAIGCTVVTQAEANRDIPHLLAAKEGLSPPFVFVSMEPLLEMVDIRPWLPGCYECAGSCGCRLANYPPAEACVECGKVCGPDTEPVFSEGCPKCGGELEPMCPDCDGRMVHQHPDTPCLDWVIAGGESGPNARPAHPDWFRQLRDQCEAACVPFHLKQMTGKAPIPADLQIQERPNVA